METTLPFCEFFLVSHLVGGQAIYPPIRVEWTPQYPARIAQIETSESVDIIPQIKIISHSSSAEQNSQIEKLFNECADRWERDTAIHSDPASIYFNRDY